MQTKPTTKQLVIIMGVPAGILCISLAAYHFMGTVALVLPPILIGMFIAYLIVEMRHYLLRLFTRQTQEGREMFAQIEALDGINKALDPRYPLPSTRGWSASPDLLREIMDLVFKDRPELVVEASSGTSTLVAGYSLQKLGKGRVVALEHDVKYATRTAKAIIEHGLEDFATVVHAPLVEHTVNGQQVLWYDLRKVTLPAPIDLLIVDGPPDTIGKLARYPAVPLLRSQFARGAKVLLDDGVRDDERITAEKWSEENGADTLQYLPLEKGAWLLSF